MNVQELVGDRVAGTRTTESAAENPSRIAPGAIPIISIKEIGTSGDRDLDADVQVFSIESCGQTETLSASPKYACPNGRTWRTDVSQLLKLNDVEERVCLKRAKIYALIETGEFPAPVKLTPGRSVWLADDINAWVHRKAEESRKTVGGKDGQ